MHSVCGLVAKGAVFADAERVMPATALTAPLEQDFGFLTCSGDAPDAPDEGLYYDHDDQGMPVSFHGFDLGDTMWGLVVLAKKASDYGSVAVVATAYFGGPGFQLSGVWRDGECLLEPEWFRGGAINHALRMIGAEKAKEIDEFDGVGLSWYRSNGDWRRFARGEKQAWER